VDPSVLAELLREEETKLHLMSDNYNQKINEYLQTEVRDALTWSCPEAQPGDWDNVPEIAVQIIDYLSKHGHAVSSYLN
jgi:hypothetical protein